MSRLTPRKFKYLDSDFDDIGLAEALNKLSHYEDLEEQGRLIELPCKVGDTVWQIRGVEWKGYDWKYPVYDNARATETKFNLEMLPRIGKTVFLTKEEAEAKLKELKEGVVDEQL